MVAERHERKLHALDKSLANFWDKPLEDLSASEWEALCDGCGRCCLVKLEDEDSGAIVYTDVGCTLFNPDTCRCNDYPNRAARVPDCVTLTPHDVRTLPWLPPTCAYRLRAEDKPLPDWHPLISGTRLSVIETGVSVFGRVEINEDQIIDTQDYFDHIVDWPGQVPRKRKGKKS